MKSDLTNKNKKSKAIKISKKVVSQGLVDEIEKIISSTIKNPLSNREFKSTLRIETLHPELNVKEITHEMTNALEAWLIANVTEEYAYWREINQAMVINMLILKAFALKDEGLKNIYLLEYLNVLNKYSDTSNWSIDMGLIEPEAVDDFVSCIDDWMDYIKSVILIPTPKLKS